MFRIISTWLAPLIPRFRERPLESENLRDAEQLSTSSRTPAFDNTAADRENDIPVLSTHAIEPTFGLEWPSPLKGYQIEGVRTLISNERLLLADDMGLGKTIQAVAAMRVLILTGILQRALLIVPASLVPQWRSELANWAPELTVMPIKGPQRDRGWQWQAQVNVVIVGYETFRSDFGFVASQQLKSNWDLVVIDEAQKIKNRRSEVSRKVKQLRRSRSWALTGTPLENTVDDLASILEFVDHTADGVSRQIVADDAMLQRHWQLQLRRTKSAVLTELPPKQVIKLPIDLCPRQMEVYRRAESEGIVKLRARGPALRITHVLELILRLKQICNFDPVSNESAKLLDIQERMQVLVDEGHRALVFSQFANNFGVETVVDRLSAFNPLPFTGLLSAPDREAVIRNFKEHPEHKALVLSLRAGGVGLNLQEASYVFHLDRWWNPAVERQAEDRAHRIGQQFPVTVYQYVCTDTIEERIDQLIASKQALFDDLVDDVSLDISSVLTNREIFGLFGLEPPPPQEHARRLTPPSLAEGCSAFLRAYGWRIAEPLPVHGRFEILDCRIVDTVGLVQSLQIWCLDQEDLISPDDIRFVRTHASTSTDEIIVVSAAELDPDAEALAMRAKIRIWDRKTIARFDHLSIA